MEHIKRENLLFESYIIRNAKDLPSELDDNKKKKKKTVDKKIYLTNEEKYEIANYECD